MSARGVRTRGALPWIGILHAVLIWASLAISRAQLRFGVLFTPSGAGLFEAK